MKARRLFTGVIRLPDVTKSEKYALREEYENKKGVLRPRPKSNNS